MLLGNVDTLYWLRNTDRFSSLGSLQEAAKARELFGKREGIRVRNDVERAERLYQLEIHLLEAITKVVQ